MSPPEELTQVIRTWSEVFMQRTMLDFRRFMDETGLSFGQIGVLMRLRYSKYCGVSHLGKQMGISNAAASQLIDKMVRKGFVERREDPDDRRAKRLSLTPAGKDLIEKAMHSRTAWLEDMAASLSPEQRQHVIEALHLLTEAARAQLPSRPKTNH